MEGGGRRMREGCTSAQQPGTCSWSAPVTLSHFFNRLVTRVIRLITLLHSVAHFVSVLLNISSVFGMACARLQVFKRPAAGSSLDRIRFQHPCGHATVTESSHRPWHQLGWPRRLQVLEQALSHGQDVPPIYRHSGPSSPRLGGGGLSKLITNSYCSYVT